MDIFTTTDLNLLLSIINNPNSTDEEVIDAAYQYDRVKAIQDNKQEQEVEIKNKGEIL